MISFMTSVYLNTLMTIWFWLVVVGVTYYIFDMLTLKNDIFKQYRFIINRYDITVSDLWWTVALGSIVWPLAIVIVVSHYANAYLDKIRKENEEANNGM